MGPTILVEEPSPIQIHLRGSDEGGHEGVCGPRVDGIRPTDLVHFPFPHYHYLVPEGHGLHLIMGNIDDSALDLTVQLL